MEKLPILKVEDDSGGDGLPEETEYAEAVEFVEKHRDFFEHYARGKVKFEPAPLGLKTFAFNLETNTIYINSRFYSDRGFSDEKTSFAVLHEIEHFLEKIGMLSEEKGQVNFGQYLKRVKESQAFSLLDNCVSDIRENRTVVSKTSKSFGDIESNLYKKDLFAETDFTSEPRHVQFAQAILREGRVPDEICAVSPDVREKLEQLKSIKSPNGAPLMDIMTDPNTPMSLRLKLQDKFVWPLCRELLDKDLEDEPKKGKGEGEGKPDPNEIFKEAYKKANAKVPNAVPQEEIEKAFKEWQEKARENPLDKADKEYAEKLGVKKEDLQRYREIVKSLEKTLNPETGESVIQELRDLFARIISHRLKPTPTPRYPVEEGEDLVHPADLVAEVKAGNLEPKVWETFEMKEKTGAKFGEVEITVVGDRSGSMEEGNKLIEQRKAAVLIMEALKDFALMCEEERVNMNQPLEIKSEVYSFQATMADRIPIKKMSRDLEEKERIEVSTAFSSAPGRVTTDYVTLETIDSGIEEETEKKIKNGELKKIIIVFTDGESGNASKVKENLLKLRDRGIVVVGIGITEDGASVMETYAPNARLAETAEKLSFVLEDLLKEHLQNI